MTYSCCMEMDDFQQPLVGQDLPHADQVVLLWVTVPHIESARALSDAVLHARLAGCVNIFPALESAYWWQGEIERSNELGLFVKTTSACAAACQNLIVERHPYDIPCVLRLPVMGGHQAFMAWLAGQTALPQEAALDQYPDAKSC